MKEYKILKDPIYGYINIPVTYMNSIVDTAVFQRLRRIIQTSYSPLFSSATHNRFVHSIGVFYLGDLVARQLSKEIKNKKIAFDTERYSELFQIACLLHDVGHAPFSHTGENCYLDDNLDFGILHDKLIKAVNIRGFKTDIPKMKSKAAAPHEIMSAILGIQQFSKLFKKAEEKEFFARCITGYKYSIKADDKLAEEKSIKNCFITMLNSKIIDVDRLDYLIRDAYYTGFSTVNIDYERLLKSVTIIEKKRDNYNRKGDEDDFEKYKIAYYKDAISVIENVVYAHDAERKWIQSHPIILYESYILQHIMTYLSKHIDTKNKKLFSLASLTEQGQTFDNNLSISLLSDDDIIYLIKNVFPNELGEEFFDRRKRRHPVWKTEAEYKTFFLNLASKGALTDELEHSLSITALHLNKNSDSCVINDDLIINLERECKRIKEVKDPDTREVQIKDKETILKVLKSLKKNFQNYGIRCNFVILMSDLFNSSFNKKDFASIDIVYKMKNEEKTVKFKECVSSLKAEEKERDNFFYLFYKQENGNKQMRDIDKQEFCNNLFFDIVNKGKSNE